MPLIAQSIRIFSSSRPQQSLHTSDGLDISEQKKRVGIHLWVPPRYSFEKTKAVAT